ncbi:MAG TPA: helix-turn-helix domain-containing protein [Bacillota bacterium]
MDNRSELLFTALQMFASRGYDAVGVQEIVAGAGVTKPTLYHYFGSKRGLLGAILTEYGLQLYEMIDENSVYQGDLSLALEKLAMAYFRFAKVHETFYRMQLAMYFAGPESEPNRMVKQMNEEQIRLVEALFIQAAKNHRRMRDRQLALAATFVGTINTYIGLALNGYIELNEDNAQQAVYQFMHGIYA